MRKPSRPIQTTVINNNGNGSRHMPPMISKQIIWIDADSSPVIFPCEREVVVTIVGETQAWNIHIHIGVFDRLSRAMANVERNLPQKPAKRRRWQFWKLRHESFALV